MFQFTASARVFWDQRSFDNFPRLIAAFHALKPTDAKTSPVRPFMLDHSDSTLANGLHHSRNSNHYDKDEQQIFLLFENVSLMKYSKKSLPEILSEDKTSDAEIQMPL
jgi:hypothetical protein